MAVSIISVAEVVIADLYGPELFITPCQRCYQDQGVRDQDQDQDLKKVVLIGLETKTRSRDMYAMLLYKSNKS